MEGFQKTVLFVSIIILIILLIFIGTSLSTGNKNQQWPPVTAECPDYWELIDSSGSEILCNNKKNLGNPTPPTPINFGASIYTGTNGNCNKYKWATAYGISWDGITYGVSNPCQTSTST